MDNKDNLRSYKDVEKLQIDLPDQEFQRYCDAKLLSAEDDVSFIKQHIYQGHPLNVCEIGCGNGKLLLAMERENMIANAVGYEVSDSRCKFASKFLNTYESKKVQVVNKNFLDAPVEKYDLIILVDIVLQFISPLYDQAEHDAMKWICDSLSTGGHVMLELEDYSNKINQIRDEGAYLFWEEFPKDDPFKYGLYKLDLDKDENLIDHKIFVGRNQSMEDQFTSVIKSYTRERMIELCKEYRMNAEIYPYYSEKNRTGAFQEHDLYRVLVRKL